MNRLSAILIPALCAALAAAAGVPLSFEVETSETRTRYLDIYRGETVELKVSFLSYGDPLTVRDCTPAFVCWQTNGMGSAWWTAPATVTGGHVRASVTPQMDPGANRWPLFVGVGSNLNYRANFTVRVQGSPGAEPNALPLPAHVIDFAAVSVTNAPWALPYAAGDNIVITNGVISSTGGGGGGIAEEHDPVWEAEKDEYMPVGGVLSPVYFGDVYPQALSVGNNEYASILYISPGLGAFYNSTGDGFTSRACDELAVKGDLSLFTPRQWVLDTIGGTNTWMAIDGENLSINTSTNAASTNVLWQSSSGIGAAVSNLSQRVTQHTAQIAALQARPDLTSWGDYAPDGTANPDPDYMLYLNSPATVFGSGFSWEQSGAYFCLVQSGAVAFAASPGQGEVRFGLDSTNYFGIVQGGSMVVGARVNSFNVADGVASLTVDYTGGDFPVAWYTGSLLTDFTEVTGTWVDNGDGSATGSFAATGAAGFYKLTTSVQLGARMHVNMPLKAAGGVVGTDAAAPVKYDSVITIQSNGHTYRIPAELVE